MTEADRVGTGAGAGTGGVRAALVAVALLLACGAARAEDGFAIQNHRPPLDASGFITLEGARALQPLEIYLAAVGQWAHQPLEVESGIERDIVRDMTYLDAVVGLGLLPIGESGGLSVGVHVPFVVDLQGREFPGLDRRLPDGGIGDIRLQAKLVVWDRAQGPIGLFGRFYGTIPSGEAERFTSDAEKVTLGGALGIDKQIGDVRLGLEVGYEWLDGEVRFGGVQVDDRLRYAAALGYQLIPALWVVAEVHGWTRAEDPFDEERESPIEVGGALRYEGATLVALAGASAGLNHGLGSPDVRVFVSLGVRFGGD